MADSMLCVSCGRTKQYPDGFPQRHFAECWTCAWDSHIHHAHPEIVRKIKRAARKRARRRAEREEFDAMFEHERRQVFGTPVLSQSPGGRTDG